MAFELPPLPYEKNALEPEISANTLDFHYGRHHQAYVNNLNNLVKDTPEANASLEDLIKKNEPGPKFNNAAQVWNHTFYWNSMSQRKNQTPSGALGDAINKAFGSYDAFKTEFNQKATTLFGSGWTWLVQNADGSLAIVQTSNAGNPITAGQKPLLTCDVWEHAYYLDYQNRRPDYINSFWNIVNWEFAAKNFAG